MFRNPLIWETEMMQTKAVSIIIDSKKKKKTDGNACWDLAYLPKLLKLWCWTTREMPQMLQKDDEISLIQGILITYHTKNGQIIL